jgi:hypothetical protein
MHLNGLYTTYTDSALDALYASTYSAVQSTSGAAKVIYQQSLTDIGYEIITRLQSGTGFMRALLGSPFPNYQRIQGLMGRLAPSDSASQSLTASASNVIDSATKAAEFVLNRGTLIALGLGAVALAFLFRKK